MTSTLASAARVRSALTAADLRVVRTADRFAADGLAVRPARVGSDVVVLASDGQLADEALTALRAAGYVVERTELGAEVLYVSGWSEPVEAPATAEQLAQLDRLAAERDVDPVELQTIREGAADLTATAAAAVIANLTARPLRQLSTDARERLDRGVIEESPSGVVFDTSVGAPLADADAAALRALGEAGRVTLLPYRAGWCRFVPVRAEADDEANGWADVAEVEAGLQQLADAAEAAGDDDLASALREYADTLAAARPASA